MHLIYYTNIDLRLARTLYRLLYRSYGEVSDLWFEKVSIEPDVHTSNLSIITIDSFLYSLVRFVIIVLLINQQSISTSTQILSVDVFMAKINMISH